MAERHVIDVFTTILMTLLLLNLSVLIPDSVSAEAPRGGIAITFDDSKFDDWLELARRYESHDVVFTFYVAGYIDDQEWSIISELEGMGHEIGAHTSNHRHPQDIVDVSGVDGYLALEVDLQIAEFSEHGIELTSFAAPFGELEVEENGVKVDLTNQLLDRFDIVRDITATAKPHWEDKLFHRGMGHHTATALRIDCSDGLTPSDQSLTDSIARAERTGETLVVYGHSITFEEEDQCIGSTPIWRIDNLIQDASEAGLEFRKISGMLDADNAVDPSLDKNWSIVVLGSALIIIAICIGSRRRG